LVFGNLAEKPISSTASHGFKHEKSKSKIRIVIKEEFMKLGQYLRAKRRGMSRL